MDLVNGFSASSSSSDWDFHMDVLNLCLECTEIRCHIVFFVVLSELLYWSIFQVLTPLISASHMSSDHWNFDMDS